MSEEAVNNLNERRLGAYGGTFDPVHNGHIEVARAVVSNFGVERLLLVPAYSPPHKDPRSISDAYHRYAMAVLATLEEPRLSVSTIELDAPEEPYSFETVARLRAMHDPGLRLFFVVGADAFEQIDTWRQPAKLLASTNVIVAARPGYEIPAGHLPAELRSSIIDLRARAGGVAVALEANKQRSAIYFTDYVSSGVSSTEIRRRVREGESIEDMVPPRVAEYIEKYELYRR